MNVLSLFAGIGGFDLGLELAGGFRTIAFCECAPFPRAVLAARWPGVPCYPDVRTLTAAQLRADGLVRPDLICGGFPCQDISSAGGGAGLDGERSRLWWEMHRIIAECRPRWVIAENSPSLRGRGADRVLGSLESLGYACWPLVVGAVHAGAWHRRQRVWVVAYLDGVREHEPARAWQGHQQLRPADLGQSDTDPAGLRSIQGSDTIRPRQSHAARDGAGRIVANPDGAELRLASGWRSREDRPGAGESGDDGSERHASHADHGVWWRHRTVRSQKQQNSFAAGDGVSGGADDGARPPQPDLVRVVHGLPARLDPAAGVGAAEGFPWFDLAQEPDIPRTAHGVLHRAERIAGLGNAVVPDVVAMIGRAIRSVEASLA